MRRKPYVGVTGFTSRDQVEAVLSVFPQLHGRTMGDWMSLPVWMMVGVLVSGKTMRGGTNRFPARYPLIEDVPNIFVDDPRCLNLIHFNTKSDEVANELKELYRILDNPRELMGVQLNIAWPEPSQVVEFRSWAFRSRRDRGYTEDDPYIVLQIGSTAFEMTGNNPEKMAEWVAEYSGTIDYVLLDPSGGEGKSFDPEDLRPYIREIDQNCNGVGIGVAGGFGPTSLDHLTPLLDEFPWLNTDAEGRLRDPESDELVLPSAVSFADQVIKMTTPQYAPSSETS